MDCFPSPEQALLAETAADFVARLGARGDTAEDASGSAATIWAQMVDLGWAELPPVELALVVEQLGRGAVCTPLPVTAALRNALPALATELDPAAVVTIAAVVPGAVDEWSGPHPSAGPTLTARYLLVPDAGAATVLVAVTASGLVRVDPHMPGVRMRRHATVGGDARFAVELDDVPITRLEGDLTAVLDHLAVSALAYALGAAESALALAVRHARERHQFGRPIGAFQAVAHRCADMRADIDACRMLAYRAAWALARGDAEFAVGSALAYANDALRRVAMHAHQVHGAIGFSTEYALHRFTRRIKAFELTYGSTARHQERFAAALGLRW